MFSAWAICARFISVMSMLTRAVPPCGRGCTVRQLPPAVERLGFDRRPVRLFPARRGALEKFRIQVLPAFRHRSSAPRGSRQRRRRNTSLSCRAVATERPCKDWNRPDARRCRIGRSLYACRHSLPGGKPDSRSCLFQSNFRRQRILVLPAVVVQFEAMVRQAGYGIATRIVQKARFTAIRTILVARSANSDRATGAEPNRFHHTANATDAHTKRFANAIESGPLPRS